jgi:glycosyltransferase involved in cell wall biosynthesis
MAISPGRHIVIANNVYPPIMAGGAELIVSYLAEGLAERGHKVTVVSTCGPEMEPYPDETRNGVEVVRFFPRNLYWSFSRGERPGYQKALWHLRDAWNRDASRRFAAITRDRRPDILHTHLIDGFSAAIWRVAQSQGARVLHTAHDYHLLCPRALMLTRDLKICREPVLGCRIYRKWHLATTRHVDLFASPSQFLIDQHMQAGLKAKAVKKVANGIPLPASAAAERDPSTPFCFVFAARLTREKGCEVVLDAVRRLPADLPVEIVVAGRGDYEEQFRAAAAADPRLRFLGYVQGDEKDALFRSADCLLLPSLWYENAPVVIVEAAAYRLPIIGSRIGAIPEFVHESETGLLFEPGNGADLAEKMMTLANDRATAERFGNNSHAFAERSSVRHMVDAYEAEYAGLLTPA